MANSSTRKKYNKHFHIPSAEIRQLSQEVHHEVIYASKKIKSFTRTELSKMQMQKKAVCIAVDDGFRIGLYHVRINGPQSFQVFDHNDELVHDFINKVSAVLYVIYLIQGKSNKSLQILDLDREINTHYINVAQIRYGITVSKKNKDFDMLDIRHARLSDSLYKLKEVEEKMQKIHRIAKANKVWETA